MIVSFLDYVESLIMRALKRREQFPTYSEAKQEVSAIVTPPLSNDHEKMPKSELVLKHQARFTPVPAAKSVVDASQRRSKKRKSNEGNVNVVKPKKGKYKK